MDDITLRIIITSILVVIGLFMVVAFVFVLHRDRREWDEDRARREALDHRAGIGGRPTTPKPMSKP